MAVESDADRLGMLADFGATVTHDGGTFTAIFGEPWQQTEDGMVAGTEPTILARSSDITSAALARESQLVVDGVSYVVRTIEPDDTGLSVLRLEAL